MTATLIRPLSAQTTPTLPRMSEQKFWRASGEGDRGEWVDGSVIVTSPVSIRHVLIVGFLNTVLGIYARRRGQGVVLGPEFALAGQCACLRDDLGDERRMRPQLINGGGRVDREYGLGRRRTDLCVIWNYPWRRAARRDRTQAAAPLAGAHAGGGSRTDLALRRHERRRRGAPHHLRPHARQSLGRENLAAHRSNSTAWPITVWGM
jgi:hypothetical protein